MPEQTPTDKQVIETITEFQKALKKLGTKKMIRELRNMQTENSLTSYESSLTEFIIKTTCDEFKVNKHQLFQSYVSGNLLDARTICIIQIKKHLNHKHLAIAKLFKKKSHVLVSDALKDMQEKNPKISYDKIFLERFNNIDTAINEFLDPNTAHEAN